MRHFARDRLLSTLLIVWGCVTLAFAALHIIPGNAIVGQMLQGGATQADIAARQAALGLDRPLPVQYVTYLAGLLRGDLGYSYISQLPVSTLIGEQLGATVMLAAAALLVAVALGLGLGILEAAHTGAWPGRLAGTISVLALSTPIYWTGTAAIFIFSSWLGLLPATGSGSIDHLILPAAVLGFHVSGSIARVTRTILTEVMYADYIRVARAKGLPGQYIFRVHILRASLPPILTVVALQIGFLLGGAAITEALFARQGIGQLLVGAVIDQDYPVVLGIVVLSALVYSTISVVTDILHGILDPRVRENGA